MYNEVISNGANYGGTRVGSDPSNIMATVPSGVWIGVSVAALVITIIVFVTIVSTKKAPRGKFAKWLREFLNFRTILISGIIKFMYLLMATGLTLVGFVIMFQGRGDSILPAIGIGIVMIVFGNIGLRVLMELFMLLIGLWENTADIRAVVVKDEENPDAIEPKAPKAPKAPEKKPVEEVVIEQVEVEK